MFEQVSKFFRKTPFSMLSRVLYTLSHFLLTLTNTQCHTCNTLHTCSLPAKSYVPYIPSHPLASHELDNKLTHRNDSDKLHNSSPWSFTICRCWITLWITDLSRSRGKDEYNYMSFKKWLTIVSSITVHSRTDG